MTGRPSGIAPEPTVDVTIPRLCGACATLIRYWPDRQAWVHAVLGFGHAPVLVGSWAPRRAQLAFDLPATERDAPIVTESELRLLDGNR